MFAFNLFLLSIWSLFPHASVGCLGGYGAVLQIHSFFYRLHLWIVFGTTKMQQSIILRPYRNSEHSGLGLISLLIYFQLQIPLVPKNSFRSVGCLKRAAASSRRSSGFSTMIKVALLRKTSSSKDFVNYLEAIKKIGSFSIPELTLNVNTIYATRW